MNRMNRAYKRPLIWLLIALGCIAITNLYAVFGHGVRSAAMDFMFLYPLLGGALVYVILKLFFRGGSKAGNLRPAMNLYNSGLATLTAGGLLRGILEIAGTASAYSIVFTIAGWGLLAIGTIVGTINAITTK